MEQALVGAAVGATIQVVLQNIISVSMKEIIQISGLKKDVKRLKDSLLMIQYFLADAEEKQVENRAVTCWLNKLESVAFKADAVIDEFNYRFLPSKVKIQMKKKVCSPSLLFRIKMSRKIKDINVNLEKINSEAKSYGLQSAVLGAHQAKLLKPPPEQTNSFTFEPNVVGRENDVSKLVEMLVTPTTDEVFLVIPIVGMGGLGKTTLARLVYNDDKIKSHFGKTIWVCVSQEFSVAILYRRILETLIVESVQFENTEAILKKLQDNLGPERFLLVLDDVWNEESDKWDDFVNSLVGITSVKGNAIIVTTRKEITASIVETLPIYPLGTLSEDNCWSIIKAKALKEVDNQAEFENVGKSIAKKCDGLPLAAKVIGGLLYGKSKETWLSILETQLSYFGGHDSIMNILKLSFDHLPSSSLKKCFVYCSIFPQHLGLEKKLVIELWMAEGFLQTDQGNDMETMGELFFNYLLQNSLFQYAKTDDYGNITHCWMHGLVHDLACSLSGSKSINLKDSGENDTYQARYLAVCSGDEHNAFQKEQAKCLRTLFLNGRIVEHLFSSFKRLHVLKLMHADVKRLPVSIGKLKHLRFLEISDTPIECLPDSIGKLYNLQTLRIFRKSGKNLLKKLPNTLTSLVSLRHLHLPSVQLPPGIGRLTCLRTLPCYRVGHGKGRGIGELRGMKYLGGEIEIHGLEIVKNEEEANEAHLFGKPNIFRLKLTWCEPREGEVNYEEVLEGLQPHPNLKSLEIDGFKGKKFPLWYMKMTVHDDEIGHWKRLDNLMNLTLTNCDQCEEIPMFGRLPQLKSLMLYGLSNVRCISPSFYGIDNSSTSSMTITPFPALKRLELGDMRNLIEWADVGVATAKFPYLESLEISSCPLLRTVPSHFPCLKKLICRRVGISFPLANICCSGQSSLEELEISGLSELIPLPDELFLRNQHLSSLII